MLILLKGGRIVDPVNGRDEIGDLWIENDRIIAAPQGKLADEVHDVSGKIVMAGAIDIHSHIAGGNVNIRPPAAARNASGLPRQSRGLAVCAPPNGRRSRPGRYASMGFTTVIEPAIRAASGACRRISNSPTFRSSTKEH